MLGVHSLGFCWAIAAARATDASFTWVVVVAWCSSFSIGDEWSDFRSVSEGCFESDMAGRSEDRLGAENR